jgi:hypothetical protein
MEEDYSVIGTTCDKLLCYKVSNLPEHDAPIAVGVELCVSNDRDEYYSGKVLFIGGIFSCLDEIGHKIHVMYVRNCNLL